MSHKTISHQAMNLWDYTDLLGNLWKVGMHGMNAQRNLKIRLGSAYNKFTPPTIANGKAYVPTADSLVFYGLLKQ